MRQVPVYKPLIEKEEIGASTQTLEEGWLGMGKYVEKFEADVEALLDGKSHAVAVSTGHAALHLALLLNGVGPGDEVLTPAFNNIADFQAILATGADVVFCDILDESLTVDLTSARQVVSDRTKAMIVLDYNFEMVDIQAATAFCEEFGLVLIHDAAHSIGSRVNGISRGSEASYTMFSFDAVKTFTCIDGGILAVKSESEVDRLRQMRLIGQGQVPAILYSNSRQWQYDVSELGFRYHMANTHAAIGSAQIAKLDRIKKTRRETIEFYTTHLPSVPGIRIPELPHTDILPFMYHIRVPGPSRNEIRAALMDLGVGTGIHWQPGHWFTKFKTCRQSVLPISDAVGHEILTLPFHSAMDHDDRQWVVTALHDVMQRYQGASQKAPGKNVG